MTTMPWPGYFTALRVIASDIKIAHSIFALPFALLAAVMAMRPFDPSAQTTSMPPAWQTALNAGEPRAIWLWALGHLLLIMTAMVFARTAAMLANRLFDRQIDARNPRTLARALPSGRLSTSQATFALVLTSTGFFMVCALFGALFGNWWPAMLSLPVLCWICLYPLLKRFTWACHLYLGSSLALSPLAAALAIDPNVILPGSAAFQASLWLLSAMVLCWVAGFDVIYALQDVEIDRREKLHSIPARFGTGGALFASRLLHTIAVLLLIACWWVDDRFSVLFAIAVAVIAALLVYEQATVARWGTSRIALAFFTLNGLISCLLAALAITDILLA